MPAAEPTPPNAAPDPYLRLRDTTLGYHGDSEDLTDLTEYRIGWFGPSDVADPLHGDFWWAANLAIEEANAAIAPRALPPPNPAQATVPPRDVSTALPIRLVPCWAPDPWRAGVSLLARMVYNEQPLALIGSIDSASTHLAEQVVTKANLPLLSPIATDKTATLAGVSWMFSCAPDDTAVARALVDELLRTTGDACRSGRDGSPSRPPQARGGDSDSGDLVGAPLAGARASQATPLRPISTPPREPGSGVVLLATTDHESRAAAREIMRELSSRGRLPEFRFDLPADVPDATEPLRSIAASDPAAVIIVANAPDSARLVRTVREQLGDVPVFGGPAMGRTRFFELAGSAAEGARFPLLFTADRNDEATARFVARFTADRGHAPDYAAAFAYDSTRLLVAAIRRAGPNRARIRDALVQLSPWSGIAGPITFDGTGQNRRAELPLGTITNGAVVTLPSTALVKWASCPCRRMCFQPMPTTPLLPHPRHARAL